MARAAYRCRTARKKHGVVIRFAHRSRSIAEKHGIRHGNPYGGRRCGHREHDSHHHGNDDPHNEWRSVGGERDEIAESADQPDERICGEYSRERQKQCAEGHKNNIQFRFTRVGGNDFHNEHRGDVRADRVAGRAEFQSGERRRCGREEIFGERADGSRHRGGKNQQFIFAECVRDAYADSRAHQGFRDVRDSRKRSAEIIIAAPACDHREDRSCDQRYEKTLRHARKRRDEIAFRQGFQIGFHSVRFGGGVARVAILLCRRFACSGKRLWGRVAVFFFVVHLCLPPVNIFSDIS